MCDVEKFQRILTNRLQGKVIRKMVYSHQWYLKIQDGKIVIVTGNWVLKEVFAPGDNEIQLIQDAIIFKRQEVEGLYHELPFKNYKIDRYTPSIEELQSKGLIGGVERNLLSCLFDIINDYIMAKQKIFSGRKPFNLDYWLEKYKEYADVLSGIDWLEALSKVPIEK